MDSKQHYSEPKPKSSMHITIFTVVGTILALYFVVVSVFILINTGKKCVEYDSHVTNYEMLRDSLDGGQKLRIIMDYSKMAFWMNGAQLKTVDEKSGFDLEDYQYFGRMSIGNPLAYMITSFNKLVVHSNYGVIYNYGKMRIFEDEYFELISYFISPTDFKILELKSFNGTLRDRSVMLYPQAPKAN